MGCFRQFKLLLWKNSLLRKRHPFVALLELISPLLLFLLAVVVRINSPPENKPETNFQIIPPFLPDQLLERQIIYTPTGGEIDQVMNAMNEQIQLASPRLGKNFIRGFRDEKDALEYSAENPLLVWGGFFFTNYNVSLGRWNNESEVTYDLRFRLELVPSTEVSGGGEGGGEEGLHGGEGDIFTSSRVVAVPTNDWLYVITGYTTLQQLFDINLLRVRAMASSIEAVRQIDIDSMGIPALVAFPFPKYEFDDLASNMKYWFPLFAIISWTLSCAVMVKVLVSEKEKRLKEAMRMMGMRNWLNQLTHFVSFMGFMTLSSALVVVIIKVGDITRKTDWSVLLVLFLLFALATIGFCFFLSTLFSSSKLGAAGGAILYFLGFIPYMVAINNLKKIPYGAKLLLCLLPPSGFGFGTNIIALYEERQISITWESVFSNVEMKASSNDLTMISIFGMLLLDTFVYLLLTWYIEAVFPGEYGIPQPYLFFLSRGYWTDGRVPDQVQKKQHPVIVDDLTKSIKQAISGEIENKRMTTPPQMETGMHETEPGHLPVGISVNGLRKTYDGKKFALNGMTANFYAGQVTCLLGHNGAGKTTTISILTGLYPPSTGNASVLNRSILTDMDWIRKNMGICPQFDILWDELTVREHLEFYSSLKETEIENQKQMVSEMISDLELTDKENAMSGTLSGGMKRKLSVAISLIGGSRVVLLDEPTSGMDPAARRSTWNLILKHKARRTIILTTHFMDEADMLSDRILIMSNGVVRTSGSSLFLKTKYGVGYHLRICKSESAKPDQITTFIRTHVPGATLKSDVGSDLSYILPSESVKQFEKMFSDLSDRMKSFGVESYGVSITTIEEVFLKVAGSEEEHRALKESPENNVYEGSSDDEESVSEADFSYNSLPHQPMMESKRRRSEEGIDNGAVSVDLTGSLREPLLKTTKSPSPSIKSKRTDLKNGWDLKTSQFFALIQKRWICTKRNRKAIILQILLPIFFVLIAMMMTKVFTPVRVVRPLCLSQWIYREYSPHLPFEDSEMDFYSDLYGYETTHFPDIHLLDITTTTTPDMPSYLMRKLSQVDEKEVTVGALSTMYVNVSSLDISNLMNGSFVFNISTNTGGVELKLTGAWFNPYATHSAPIYLNLASNLLSRKLQNASRSLGISSPIFPEIKIRNYPLPASPNEFSRQLISDGTPLTVSVNILFGLAFLVTSFATFLVTERSTNAKHLQFVSGVDPLSYWLSSYLWDIVCYLFSVTLIVVVIYAFQAPAYVGITFWPIVALLVLYGLASLPFMYLSTFFFHNPSSCFVAMMGANLLMGIGTTALTFILEGLHDGEKFETMNKVLKWVFVVLFPNFGLGRGLMDLTRVYYLRVLDPTAPGVWDFDVIGKNLIFMAIHSVLLWIVLILSEYFHWSNIFASLIPSKKESSLDDMADQLDHVLLDDDVMTERDRILGGKTANDILVIKELGKKYKNGKQAVRNVSLGVTAGQCFGLLGVNGAGKTTTFKMLTGEIPVTHGDAIIDHWSILSDMVKVRQRIGYCPQFDAIIPYMTGRELLTMYAKLRGVEGRQIDSVVRSVISMLQLDKWIDRTCGEYSGGNKRKLSTAIALVGDPPIIFLDEPTTGMDPKAKRFLWNTLTGQVAKGQTIILTSHSMEECEVLCSRLAIMVGGQFQCLGSLQHLKEKFGQGYCLTVKFKPINFDFIGLGKKENQRKTLITSLTGINNNLKKETEKKEREKEMIMRNKAENVIRYILSHFPGARVAESYNLVLKMSIPQKEVSLSNLFGRLEEKKVDFDVEEYSICQTSLEEVFLRFAQTSDQQNNEPQSPYVFQNQLLLRDPSQVLSIV